MNQCSPNSMPFDDLRGTTLRPKPERQVSLDSGCEIDETNSIASQVVGRRQLQRRERRSQVSNYLAAEKERQTAIKSSVFEELKEIRDDFIQMGDQVSQATENLRQLKRLRSYDLFYIRRQPESDLLSCDQRQWTPRPSNKRKLHVFDEDEMVDVTHRVLKRVCQLSLARAEGHLDMSLLI